jgi:hypothetical protein
MPRGGLTERNPVSVKVVVGVHLLWLSADILCERPDGMKSKELMAACILVVASFTAGCGRRDTLGPDLRVGNVYEVVGNLCVIADQLKDERTDTLEAWQKHAEKFQKPFVKLPLGTKIRIVSVEKQTRSSWNTGRYSYYTVFVSILAPEHGGVRYDASHLVYGEKFGKAGTNLVTLKLVSNADQR